ncbi:MAG TPA: hypothetical protein VFB63_10890 [Bryobacteraceae bacterium]|nr:hypothetical protein [Bryobacteraceae bacterium]
MGNPRLILVVTLEVRNEAAADFERFETHAAAIMSRWDGRIERVIRFDGAPASCSFREIHIVSFPNLAALDAYRRDPELAALKELRDKAIVTTEVAQGRDLAIYGAAD